MFEACHCRYNTVAPDISGYGKDVPCSDPAPSSLNREAEPLAEKLRATTRPIHLAGHSFSGAPAFKLATSGRYTPASVNDNSTDNIVALHCSLSSGKQWAELIEACGSRYNAVAPDMSGYGENPPWPDPASSTLEIEVEQLSEKLDTLAGPLHVVGHSFGGAVAFKLASSERYAHRVRSLTLIEPILPSLLLEQDGDRPLYDLFTHESDYICSPIWAGQKELAVKRFLRFWNGQGYWERLSSYQKIAFLTRANKLVGDLSAIFGETGVGEAARRLTVPTLLFSGGASSLPAQQFVKRLASIIPHARHIHLAAADHLMPITYASEINTTILELIDLVHS